MANFELYQPDNTTPIAIAQPRRTTWEREAAGRFAGGSPRMAHYARVVWQFPRLTPAEYQIFIQNRPASGVMQFKTWEQPIGGAAAQYVKCSGVMEPITSGHLVEGEYLGTQITWTKVATV